MQKIFCLMILPVVQISANTDIKSNVQETKDFENKTNAEENNSAQQTDQEDNQEQNTNEYTDQDNLDGPVKQSNNNLTTNDNQVQKSIDPDYYPESTLEHEKAEREAEEAASNMNQILDVKTPEELPLDANNTSDDKNTNQSNTDKTLVETWDTIIKDLIKNNGQIKAAYLEYRKSIALATAQSVNTFLPDNVSLSYQVTGSPDNFNSNLRDIAQTGGVSLSKKLNVGSYLSLGVLPAQILFAKAKLEEALIKELQELLQALVILIQAGEVENAHELNLSKLERGMRSVKLRADKIIGLVAQADVANADASYELGKSQFIEAKENIRQARKTFINKVGREPGDLSKLSDIVVEEVTNMEEFPEVRSALHAYRQARAATLASVGNMLSPRVALGYTGPMGNEENKIKNINMQLSFDVYNGEANTDLINKGANAKQALEQYKFALQSLEAEQAKYVSRKISYQSQEMALLESVKAAERYALSEERQFEAAYSPNNKEIISPDNMLRAFNQAHDRKLRWLDMQGKIITNNVGYAIRSGQIFKSLV